MKLFFIAIIFCLVVANIACAQSDTAVHFVQGLSWGQIKEKAKAENKYIFVDCYASWCGPCKMMDINVYPNAKVGGYMNQHFISLKAQMDTSKKDDDRIKQFYEDAHLLMQEYKITAFPTFLFFSPDCKMVHSAAGFKGEDDFISLSKDAIDPNKQYYTLVERFKRHDLDTSYMKTLARNASSLGDNELAGKIANDYIDKLSEDQLFKPENIRFMWEFTISSKDRGFAVFKDHSDKIFQADKRIDENQSKLFVERIIYNEEIKPYESSKDGKTDWDKMKSSLNKYGFLGVEAFDKFKPGIIFRTAIAPALKTDPDWKNVFALIKRQHAGKGEEFLVGSSLVYYLNGLNVHGTEKNCKNVIAAAKCYFKNFYSYLTAEPLNNWAWTIFKHSTDKKELALALVWSDSCLKLSPKPDAAYIDTHANLLYKIGRIQEAISWEEKAANLPPMDEEIQDNFLKMKKGIPTWPNN